MSAVLHATDSLSANALHVTRLEPTIGAEISGIDLRQPLTPALRDELRRLLLEHKVIFFRDQAISTEQQIAFAREFGELYVHPTTEQNDTTQPHAHLIQAQDARTLYGPRVSGRWHTDTSWLLRPTLGAVLRAVRQGQQGRRPGRRHQQHDGAEVHQPVMEIHAKSLARGAAGGGNAGSAAAGAGKRRQAGGMTASPCGKGGNGRQAQYGRGTRVLRVLRHQISGKVRRRTAAGS